MTQTKRKSGESAQVRYARWRRAKQLCIQLQEWQRLANQKHYPRSQMDICGAALEREYRLGQRSEKVKP
jgi:hypothetical protein